MNYRCYMNHRFVVVAVRRCSSSQFNNDINHPQSLRHNNRICLRGDENDGHPDPRRQLHLFRYYIFDLCVETIRQLSYIYVQTND